MNEDAVREAFRRMFPNENLNYDIRIKFSKKFSPYNANVRKIGRQLVFSFSADWKGVSKEISIGLIQELLLKILKKKSNETTNMGLYASFVKNLHLSAGKAVADARLKGIFEKVNSEYFHNSLEMPSLKWGLTSRRRLATYDYHTDTINVSSIFKEAEEEVIAYLLYHEMLHKKLKFSTSSGRSIHHSSEFRKLERAFENREMMEKRLQAFVRKKAGVFQGFLKKFI